MRLLEKLVYKQKIYTNDDHPEHMYFNPHNAYLRIMEGHIPVLLDECLRLLEPSQGGDFLDATFGGGGHSEALLEANPKLKLIALDRDCDAEIRAQEFGTRYGERFSFIASNFTSLESLIPKLGEGRFSGILFDLGVSSFQLDESDRGFSFRNDAPLDMRMDTRSGQTAADFLETASEQELVVAIRNYGEEVRWKRVVRAIIAARGTGALQRTASLAELIKDSLGVAGKKSRIHPATLSFQGIRIAINAELEAIESALPAAFKLLKPGGVLAVISFHSLEDRIIKRFSNRVCGRPEHGRDNRSSMDRIVEAKLLTRKAIIPTEIEISNNPRSRSSKLRAIQKLYNEQNQKPNTQSNENKN